MTSVARVRETVRYALPFDMGIAVVSEGHDELLDLDGMRTLPVPELGAAQSSGDPKDGRTLLSTLDEVRAEGAHFLLVPSTATALLGELREQLGDSEIVVEEPEVCTIFALHEGAKGWSAHQMPDGLPLPPPEMVALTTGNYDPAYFFQSGLDDAECAAKLLESNGLSLDSFETILDFGCGCGRTLRHWKDLDATIHGADYNPYCVDWCSSNLSFASFERTFVGRELSYPDNTFDFIFAFSVFTHLVQEAQDFWLRELRRVLAPQGFLLFSVHGSFFVEAFGPEVRKTFDSGELVIVNPGLSGSSWCAAYHPEAYIRDKMTTGFDLIDLAFCGMRSQDGVLLRKPA